MRTGLSHVLALAAVDLSHLRANVRRAAGRLSTYLFAVFTLGGLALLYGGSLGFFGSFRSLPPEVARATATVLLAAFFNTLTFMAVFAGFINGLSALYLAEDRHLLKGLPLGQRSLFVARSLRVWLMTLWITFFVTLPLVAALARTLFPGEYSCLRLMAALSLLTVMGTSLGLCAMTALARVFAPQTMRIAVAATLVVSTLTLLVMFRGLDLEHQVVTGDVKPLAALTGRLSAPLDLLPGTLAVKAALGRGPGLFPVAGVLALLTGLLLWAGAVLFASRREEETAARESGRTPFARGLPLYTAGSLPWKDALTVLRSPQYLVQALFLMSMAAIYGVSIALMRHQGPPGMLAVLNLLLAGMVVAVPGVRVLLPLLNMEGRAVWVLMCAPLSSRKLTWAKYRQMLLVNLALAWCFTLLSAALLPISAWSVAVTGFGLSLVAVGSASSALLMGSLYVDFTRTDPAAIAAGMGGILYTALAVGCALLTALLLAYPLMVTEDLVLPLDTPLPLSPAAAVACAAVAAVLVAIGSALCLWGARFGLDRLRGATG